MSNKTNPTSIDNLLSHTKSVLIANKLSLTTRKLYLADIKRFLHWLTNATSSEARKSDVGLTPSTLSDPKIYQAYLEHLEQTGLSPAMLARTTASLKRLGLIISDLYAQGNPFTSSTTDKPTHRSTDMPTHWKYINYYTNYLTKTQLSKSTIKSYKSDVTRYLAWAVEHKISTKLSAVLTTKNISKYLKDLSNNNIHPDSTIARKQASLTRFQAWYLDAYPTKIVTDNKFSPLQGRSLSPQGPSLTGIRESNSSRALRQEKGQSLPGSIYSLFHRPIFTALNLGLLSLLILSLGFFGYRAFSRDQVLLSQAYPSSPVTPNRQLSFQGRLEDSAGTPITSSTNLVFKLYNASTSGTELYSTGTCAITPDSDGVFSTQIGGTCGSGIASSVFSENADVWLEVTVGAEILDPRQQIATVAYSLNAETLQGIPLSATMSAVANSVVPMNQWGEIIVGEQSPKLTGISGTFAISAPTLTLSTTTGSSGNITIAPDGTGQVNILGNTTTGDFFNISNAQLTTGSLITGTVGNNNTGFNLIDLQSGSSPSSVFSVAYDGGVTTSSTLTLPNSNTLTGVTNYTRLSQGLSVGGADTYYFSSAGSINANAATFASAVTLNSVSSVADNNQVLTIDGGVVKYIDTTNWDKDGSDDLAGANLPWVEGSGILYPKNSTLDLLIGGQATSSAKFAFTNINSGTPTLSMATQASAIDLVDTTVNALDIESGLLSFDTSNSRIGIGTTAPEKELDVRSGTPTIQLESTNNGAYYTQIKQNYADEGFNINVGGTNIISSFGYNDADSLSIGVKDYEDTLHIDTNGSVGIGTTNPLFKLDVAGTASVNSLNINDAYTLPTADGTTGYVLQTDGAGNVDWAAQTGGGAAGMWQESLGAISPNNGTWDVLIGSTATSSAKFAFTNINSGTPTLNFGSDTTLYRSAANNLKTDDTLSAGDGSNFAYGINSGSSGLSGWGMTGTHIIGSNTSGDSNWRYLVGYAGNISWGNGTDAVDTTLYRNAADTLRTNDTLIVDGNLGIGTTAPESELEIGVASSDTPGANSGGIKISRATDNTLAHMLRLTATTKDLAFDRQDDTDTWYESLRIQRSSGNVGIGDTTPTSMLTVGNGDLFQVNSSGIVAAIDGIAHTIEDVAGNLTLTSAASAAVSIVNDLYVSSGISTFGTAVSDGTIEATQFCTGDGETNCVTDFSTLIAGAGVWTDAGTYIHPTASETLGNSASAGSNKITGLYLADSAPLTFGTDNDISFTFSGSELSTTLGANSWNIASNLLFLNGSSNQIGIGTSSPLATLDIRGLSGTTPVASISGNTSMASLIVDQSGTGDIFAASSSGETRFVVKNNGNVGIGVQDPSSKLEIGGSTSTISNDSGDITINAASNFISLAGDSLGNLLDLSVAGTASISGNINLLANNYINWGDTDGSTGYGIRDNAGTIEYKNSGGSWAGIGSGGGATGWTYSSPYLYPDNATDFVGIGTTTTSEMHGLLTVSGAKTGQALAIFNETGDQDIIVASASGITRFRVASDGSTHAPLFVDSASSSFYLDPAATGTSLSIDGSIVSNGAFSLSTGSDAIAVSIGTTGAGKLNAGTIDPPYTINGDKFATYLSGMTGVKEETTGKINTSEHIPGYGYRATLNFATATEGSDLWLFREVTNLYTQLDELVVLLSSNSNARTWYKLDETAGIVEIYSDSPTTISYRLTAPRFDANDWTNVRTDEGAGFILTGQSNWDGTQASSTPSQDSFTISKLASEFYQLINNTTNQVIESTLTASRGMIAQLEAGRIETQELVSPLISATEINTSTISANTTNTTTLESELIVSGEIQTATLSARLAKLEELDVETLRAGNIIADSITADSIEGLDAKIASLSAGSTATLSDSDLETITDRIKARLADFTQSAVEGLTSTSPTAESLTPPPETNSAALPIPSTEYSILDTASDSATLASLDADMVFINDYLAVIGQATITDLDITSHLYTDSIISKSDYLSLAPTGGIINMASNTLIVDSSGEVMINGNLTVSGKILADSAELNSLQIGTPATSSATLLGDLLSVYDEQGKAVATIDASGSANLRQLSTELITIAAPSDATESATTSALAQALGTSSKSNATAGEATLVTPNTELVIESKFVTENTLVYLTPTTNTDNKVVFVKAKETCPPPPAGISMVIKPCTRSFTVAIDSPANTDISFNWWIIELTNPTKSTQ